MHTRVSLGCIESRIKRIPYRFVDTFDGISGLLLLDQVFVVLEREYESMARCERKREREGMGTIGNQAAKDSSYS